MHISGRALVRRGTRWLGEAAVHLLPSRCFACRRALPRLQCLNACVECWARLVNARGESCRRCALPLPGTAMGAPAGGRLCTRCAIRSSPFERAVAAVWYDDHARRFLLRGKDGHRPELLAALAQQLAAAISIAGTADGIEGIVPVPSSPVARWRRGFEPARLLAEEIARSTSIPLLGGILRKRLLGGPVSKAMNAPARWAWAARSVVSRRDVPDAALLLVDDVMTTGATATACALALLAAGAREVRVAVWARTPSPGFDFDRATTRRL